MKQPRLSCLAIGILFAVASLSLKIILPNAEEIASHHSIPLGKIEYLHFTNSVQTLHRQALIGSLLGFITVASIAGCTRLRIFPAKDTHLLVILVFTLSLLTAMNIHRLLPPNYDHSNSIKLMGWICCFISLLLVGAVWWSEIIRRSQDKLECK